MDCPHEANCFYEAQKNSIYIMGAFARGGIYRSDMSDEELYGILGSVIGHEISHAFDSSGAQFDKDGNMVDWWTEEDYGRFLERNDKIEAYYNNIYPWEGQAINGSIVTGEVCADMAGLKVMLRLAKEKPDFDYDAFFHAFATLWLEKGSLVKEFAEGSTFLTAPITYYFHLRVWRNNYDFVDKNNVNPDKMEDLRQYTELAETFKLDTNS